MVSKKREDIVSRQSEVQLKQMPTFKFIRNFKQYSSTNVTGDMMMLPDPCVFLQNSLEVSLQI